MLCEIDWAALGTWAAVVLALSFQVRDIRDRREREGHEARVIAHLLLPELETLFVRTKSLVSEANPNSACDVYDVLLESEPHLRQELAAHIEGFTTQTLDRSVDRLHVLPANVSRALLALLAEIRFIEKAGEQLKAMDNAEAQRVMDQFLPPFRKTCEDCNTATGSALTACRLLVHRGLRNES